MVTRTAFKCGGVPPSIGSVAAATAVRTIPDVADRVRAAIESASAIAKNSQLSVAADRRLLSSM
jgi:hypothetical protein